MYIIWTPMILLTDMNRSLESELFINCYARMHEFHLITQNDSGTGVHGLKSFSGF